MAWLSGVVVSGSRPLEPRTPRQQLVGVLRGVIDDLLAEGDEDAATVALEAVMRLADERASTALHDGR